MGEWEPLAAKIVVEIRNDHFTGGRHGTKLLRWRPDKPRSSARSTRSSSAKPPRFDLLR